MYKIKKLFSNKKLFNKNILRSSSFSSYLKNTQNAKRVGLGVLLMSSIISLPLIKGKYFGMDPEEGEQEAKEEAKEEEFQFPRAKNPKDHRNFGRLEMDEFEERLNFSDIEYDEDYEENLSKDERIRRRLKKKERLRAQRLERLEQRKLEEGEDFVEDDDDEEHEEDKITFDDLEKEDTTFDPAYEDYDPSEHTKWQEETEPEDAVVKNPLVVDEEYTRGHLAAPRDTFLDKLEAKTTEQIKDADLDERLKRLGVVTEKDLQKKREKSNQINHNKYGYGEKSDKVLDPLQYIRNYKRTPTEDTLGERMSPPIPWDEEARISGEPNHPNPFYGWKINDTDITKFALMEHYKGDINAWHHYMTDRTKMVEPLMPDHKMGWKYSMGFTSHILSPFVDFKTTSSRYRVGENDVHVNELLSNVNVAMIEWDVVNHLKRSGIIDPRPMPLEEMNALYKFDRYINQVYMPYGDPDAVKILRTKDERIFQTNKFRPVQVPVQIDDHLDYIFYKGLLEGAIQVSNKRASHSGVTGQKTALLLPQFKLRHRTNIAPDFLMKFFYSVRSGFEMKSLSNLTYLPLEFKNQVNVASSDPVVTDSSSNLDKNSTVLTNLLEVDKRRQSKVSSTFNQVAAGTVLLTATSLYLLVTKKPKGGPFRQPTPKTLKRAFATLSTKPSSLVQVLPKERICLDYSKKFFNMNVSSITNSIGDKLRHSNSRLFFDWSIVDFHNDDAILLYDIPVPIVEQLLPALLDARDGTYLITNQDFEADQYSEWKLVSKVLDFPETLAQRERIKKGINSTDPNQLEELISETEVIKILAENDEKEVRSEFTVGDLDIKELCIYQKNPDPSTVPSEFQIDQMIQQQFKEVLSTLNEQDSSHFSFDFNNSGAVLDSIPQFIANEAVKIKEMNEYSSPNGESSTRLNKLDWDFPVIKNDFLNFMLKGKSKVYKAHDMYEFFPKFEPQQRLPKQTPETEGEDK